MVSTSFLLTYHRCNALLCPPIGFFLNLLLLWLILHRTPKDMWVHSRVLLQTCILDILMLTILAIGGHTIVVNQSFGKMAFFQGYFLDIYQKLWDENSLRDGLQLLMLLSFGIFHLDTHSISAQFLYRYLVLNRGVKISIRHYLLLLLPPLLFNLALYSTMPHIFIKGDLANLEREMISHGLIAMDMEKPVFFAHEALNDFYPFWTLSLLSTYLLFYAIILFCGIRMVRFVSAHSMTERLKELNRQLSRNLIILAAFPLLMDMIIASFYLALDRFSTSNELIMYMQIVLSPLMYWLSVINPVISIWTFRPYREAIGKILRCKLKITPLPN